MVSSHLCSPFSSIMMFSPSEFKTDHDVFLSFRGEDTPYNFTGHLYRALWYKGIHTELNREEEISPSLITTIRGSKISIIIFSKNYASSSLCLDELVEILECRKSLGQLVLPVFFHMDPSDLRKHRNSFRKALTTYEKTEEEEKLPKWKLALTEAAYLSGWILHEGGDEYQLIQQIVEDALKKLNHRRLLYVAEYTVGIESYLAELGPLIDVAEKEDVRFIGVCGMGGVGKTTIAKAVFNKFADEFEGSSFLADVRETSKQHLGMVKLQETLLFDMLGDKNIKVGNIHIIRDRLCQKRVLLVLDDVDEQDQLETLAGGHEWFGSGSRIIITTRNKHLLTTHEADGIYEVQGLNHERAFELFSWNAFRMKKNVDEDYLKLSNRIVRYASGLPLALVVFGSFLRNKSQKEWPSAVHNLEKKLPRILYEILKISYDVLKEDEKALFLDIACFFVGEDKDYVIKVLGSSNFSPIIGIKVLSDMSLINVDGRNKLRMHNLIEEVGKEIVCRESPEAGNRSRLWSPYDIFHVFTENTGTNSIQGIMLKLPEQRNLYLNATSFKKLKRLRLLIFANVVISIAGIVSLPDELRLIDLPGYQFLTFPFNSGPKLVILNMQHSCIHRLDIGFKNFAGLKVLNFSHSKFLKKIPDLSTAPNLESLNFGHCESLVEIHESVGFLTKLLNLDLENCSSLSIFLRNLACKNLRNLVLRGCSRLQNFPNIVVKMEFLTDLDVSHTAITELPSTIELIVGLRFLFLDPCAELIHIPSSIYKLLNLHIIRIRSSTKLIKFPKYADELEDNQKFLSLFSLSLCDCNLTEVDFLANLFRFPNLQSLNLSENKFVTLPFFHSSTLEELDLSNNKFLVSLPSFRNLPKLSSLEVHFCELLEEIPELPDVGKIKVDASGCRSLVKTPWKIMAKMISNDKGFFRDCKIEATFSGLEVPEWFSHKFGETITFNQPPNIGESITFDVPPNMLKNISAVIFCAVWESEGIEFDLSFEFLDGSDSSIGFYERLTESTGQGDTWLIYIPAKTLFHVCETYGGELKNVRKIRVSLNDESCPYISEKEVSSCGMHIVWDQDELIIDNKLIKVSQNCHNDHDFARLKDLNFSHSNLNKIRDLSTAPNLDSLVDMHMELKSFPNWGGYGSFSCLVKVDLVCCKSCYCLPPLGQLPSLKKLHIQGFDRVERIGDEFYSTNTLSLSKPFKSLQSLTFSHMLWWKEWSFMKNGVFSDLKQLTLDNCRKLKGMCFPNYLPSLKSLLISGCKQELVASLSTDGLPLLSFLKIGQCKELKSFPIRALPANVDTVKIMGCKELVSLSEDGWPSKLKSLEISYCGKLFGNSLWWNLRALTSLTSLQIIKIDEVVDSFPEEWQLPTTLKSLTLSHFRNLKSLNGKALQHHTSLQELKIEFCHHLHYLPEEGLPDSLSQLEIFGCGFLNGRCQKERGEDWPKISHIPHIRIDCKEI